MSFKNTLLNFILYLKNPKVPHSKKTGLPIKSFISLFIFSLCVDYLLDLISTNSWVINKLQITNIQSHNQELYSNGFWHGFILLVITAPIIEEILQRSYLKSFVWNYTLVPINSGLILIFLFQIRGIYLLILFPILLVMSNIIYSRITNYRRAKIVHQKSYINNYSWYFYLSALSFGVMHIGNYESAYFIPFLHILLVLPQIFGGLMLGYIRIFMGLRWSIYFHALHNLFFLILLFINH